MCSVGGRECSTLVAYICSGENTWKANAERQWMESSDEIKNSLHKTTYVLHRSTHWGKPHKIFSVHLWFHVWASKSKRKQHSLEEARILHFLLILLMESEISNVKNASKMFFLPGKPGNVRKVGITRSTQSSSFNTNAPDTSILSRRHTERLAAHQNHPVTNFGPRSSVQPSSFTALKPSGHNRGRSGWRSSNQSRARPTIEHDDNQNLSFAIERMFRYEMKAVREKYGERVNVQSHNSVIWLG